jgi:cholesterol oxidase
MLIASLFSDTLPDVADYDIVVIGSGVRGSVTALRLTEKGYRVAVLEAGHRWDESSYPLTSWQLRRFVWAPLFGCFGFSAYRCWER